MVGGKAIENNFDKDHFLGIDKVLNIIDDYNVVGINDDAKDFFVKSFGGQGARVKTINIYYQYRNCNHPNRSINVCLRNNFRDISIDAFKYVFALLKISFKKIKSEKDSSYDDLSVLRDLHTKLKPKREIMQHTKDCIDAFNNEGIELHLISYPSYSFKPPFHGRYWLGTNNVGYIVDGSLNTYNNGMIFAQKMDQENYGTIKKIFDKNIYNHKLYVFDADNISEILRTLIKFCDENLDY